MSSVCPSSISTRIWPETEYPKWWRGHDAVPVSGRRSVDQRQPGAKVDLPTVWSPRLTMPASMFVSGRRTSGLAKDLACSLGTCVRYVGGDDLGAAGRLGVTWSAARSSAAVGPPHHVAQMGHVRARNDRRAVEQHR